MSLCLFALIVGVETRALENHTDLAELLTQGVLAALGAGLERVVRERLVLLKHVAAVLALVNVNRHG